MPNVVPSHIIQWFAANKFVLNLDNTNIMNFTSKNSSYLHYICYKEKYIEEMVNTKFLGLQIDNHLNW